MSIVNRMSAQDGDFLIDSVDRYIAAGVSPASAQSAAVSDLIARIAEEKRDADAAVREQMRDLFMTAAQVPEVRESYLVSQTLEEVEVDIGDIGPLSSRSLEEEMAAQQDWLGARAEAAGYRSVQHLVDNDFDLFMRLAEKWRDENFEEIGRARDEVVTSRHVGGYTLPTFGVGSMTIEALQDRYNRWKQVVDSVRSQGGVVTEANNFYLAEERFWGIVASMIDDFGREVDRFVNEVAADGLSLNDIALYAYAKHAKERNERMRRERAAGRGGWDSWSGMTDEEADDIIDDVKQSGLQDKFDEHHATLMGWTHGTRDALLAGNLITDEQYMTLDGMYDNYVPLKGNKALGESSPRLGKGYNIRGQEIERARGRYSRAENVIENIIQDRVRAVIRSGKNDILRSFLLFVLENPDQSLWSVDAVENKPVFTVDDFGNQVIEEHPSVVKDDRTISIKDGGREVYVLVRDEKLREQMNNMNVEQLTKALGLMLTAQRALGRMYTSLNPVFTVTNWAKDVQTSTVGMVDEVGYGGALLLWKNLPGAILEAAKAEVGRPSESYQIFRASGGKTGFMDFKTIGAIANDLSRKLKNAERMWIDPRVWGPAALDLVESVNAVIENSTRYAAFKSALESGESVARSASISKNISVNFNRRGTWSPQLSALFLFFNPAVQGTARMAQMLSSPKALTVIGAGMTGVALLALQNAIAGDDDDGVAWWDKVPQSVKDRNLIIILPPFVDGGEPIKGVRTGRYVKIPLPYGLNFFATLANSAVDMWRNSADPARGVKPTRAMANVFSSFLGAYMPVSEIARAIEADNPKSAVLAAVPDFLNPIAQSALNVNSFGRPMYPENVGAENLADASKFFGAQAGTIYQKTAQALNEATGGNAYRGGLIDITPATVEVLVRSYGGGPASFVLDAINAMYARQSIERPDLDVRRLPFIKQVYGLIDAETDRFLAYERMREISSVVDPIEAARRNRDREAAVKMVAENGPIYKLAGAIDRARDKLSQIRKAELTIIDSKLPDSVKYAKLRDLDTKKRVVLQNINAAYDAAMREQRAEEARQGQGKPQRSEATAGTKP